MTREQLSLVRLTLPELPKRKLVDALRLQLLQFYPTGFFAFAFRRESSGQVAIWAWKLPAAAEEPERTSANSWPAPLLELPGNGFRLLLRAEGVEAQNWLNSELQASQWFAQPPSVNEWQRFVRGCGADVDLHPLPAPTTPQTLPTIAKGWKRADNLPRPDPWKGWHWQVGVLVTVTLLCAAIGAHLQMRAQLEADREALAALRKQRAASLEARTGFERARSELDAIQALAPQLSQLELLDRVLGSGVLTVAGSLPQGSAPVPSGTLGANSVVAQSQDATTRAAPTALFAEWEFRNHQLKLTLEIPEGDIAMLDITRRMEAIPGLSALKVGQDTGANSLALSMRVGSPEGAIQAPGRNGN